MNYPFDEAQIWVGCLASYNAGDLIGKWFKLDLFDNSSEFYQAIRDYFKELDQTNPLDFGLPREEWQFNDWDSIPDFLISQYSLKEAYWLLRDKFQEESKEEESDPFFLFCAYYGYHSINEETLDKTWATYESSYKGHYGDNAMEKFAREKAEQEFGEELIKRLDHYFNYAAYQEDLEANGFWEEDGYVFEPV